MRASFTGLLAGMLLAVAIVAGGGLGVLLALLLGLIGFAVGAAVSGEHRSFKRLRRRRVFR
ncbi:hypothetical protein LO763_24780 [Glycomyces sp. A-F 0318]|uniref:hypothetical protein n=1 Tax=Glycomyces amatae TaxID=2881355 RepID=UPI001E32C384|nr:hypothetical protein [Glycomyces amatae]MCD0446838.1 hypothetical protein [Glycomyces amatae]